MAAQDSGRDGASTTVRQTCRVLLVAAAVAPLGLPGRGCRRAKSSTLELPPATLLGLPDLVLGEDPSLTEKLVAQIVAGGAVAKLSRKDEKEAANLPPKQGLIDHDPDFRRLQQRLER